MFIQVLHSRHICSGAGLQSYHMLFLTCYSSGVIIVCRYQLHECTELELVSTQAKAWLFYTANGFGGRGEARRGEVMYDCLQPHHPADNEKMDMVVHMKFVRKFPPQVTDCFTM